MQCNIGTIDRIIRVLIGLGALVWGVMNGNIIADIVGVVLLFTAITGFCILYVPFGINTGCKKE